MRPASSGLWVAISAASPVPRTSPSSTSKTRPEVSGSRLPVGSSASSSRGAVGERAGEGHPLLLAARELGRPVFEPVPEPDRVEELARPRRGRRARRRRPRAAAAPRSRARRTRAAGGGTGRRSRRASRRSRVRARSSRPGGVLPEQPHRPRGRHVEEPGDVQERRLARPRRRDQRHHLAGVERQARRRSSTVDRGRRAGVVDLADRLEREDLTHSAAPRPGSAARRCAPGRA